MATSTGESSRFAFEPAIERDDGELRALLRRNPIGGAMRVTFEREPSFFAAAALQGESVQVGVARDRMTGRIIGLGTRAVTQAFLNGEPENVGYLGDLRLEPQYQRGTLAARGYRLLRSWHEDGRVPLYFTVIFTDNDVALRTIASGRAGLPAYHDLGLIRCPGINLRGAQPPVDARCEVMRANASLLPAIVACLNRNNARKQFAPVQRAAFFEGRWRDFHIDDFYVARRGGRVIGVAGKWDQRTFKQTRVAGYSRPLSWVKPLANALYPRNTPRFPERGECIPYFCVSFVAIDDDELGVFRALLRRVYNDAVRGPFLYFLVGLHERDPLAAVLDDYQLTPFAGRLFAVCFEDGEERFRVLDGRVPYVEIATL